MRFEMDATAATGAPIVAPMQVERTRATASVLAPQGWTGARVEAWLDWAQNLPTDYPAIDLPEGLGPDQPFDPALDEGPDR